MLGLCWSRSKMYRLIIISLIILILNISTFYLALATDTDLFQLRHEKENIIFVDQRNELGPWTGSEEFPLKSISDALQIARPYDTIYIKNGVYIETVMITFPIRLIGVDAPIIDGKYCDKILSVSSSNVYIENIHFIHANGYTNDAGIFIDHVSNISIVNCIIHHTKTGIFVNQSNQVNIVDTCVFHSGNAIRIDNSSLISIDSCDFSRNSIVILMCNSSQLFVNESVFISNGLSASITNSKNILVDRSNITDNSVNKGGLFFSNTEQVFVKDSLFRHNGVGISFSNVTVSFVSYCEFVNNTHFAISYRKSSYQITISHCKIENNIRNGVYIESGNICLITNSHIIHNALYAIQGKFASYCDARNNWWGHPFGPFHSMGSKFNKLSFFRSRIVFFPWKNHPIDDIGIRYMLSSPRHNHTFEEPIQIVLDGVDTDNDSMPDWWEEKWGYSPYEKDDHFLLDPDKDGLNNIQECYTDHYGSNPFKKDIFLELDWMYCKQGESNRPELAWFTPLIDSYAAHDIALHIDLGRLDGGEEIDYQCAHIQTYAALEDIYWTYFLDNDLQNPRKSIFRYGLLCNFCPDLNFPFVGWNALDSFAISVEWLVQSYPQYSREEIIIGGIAHHLGHTLGLIADTYPGIDNVDTLLPLTESWRNYLSYRSCMNYLYKYKVLTFSDGSNGKGDFNDWDHIDFTFFQKGIFEER